MLNVLQITDCHLVVEDALLIGVDTQASLEAVLAQAVDERTPDAIIASGDLAHDPLPDVYARFLDTIRACSDAPLLCLPGNHDVLASMSVLPRERLDLGNWSIVPFDSHEDDKTPALVTEADRRQAPDAIGRTAAEHILVAAHHPFVEVNAPWLDRDRIQKPEELVEWLAECSQPGSRLRAIVFGHAHQEVTGHCAKVPVYGTPSTCFQFKPGSQQFALDDEHPGYRWLELAEDGGLATEVRRVTTFAIEPVLGR